MTFATFLSAVFTARQHSSYTERRIIADRIMSVCPEPLFRDKATHYYSVFQ